MNGWLPRTAPGGLKPERSEARKQAGASGDFLALHRGQPPDSELLDGKTRQHGAVDHGGPQSPLVDAALARQISHESAGKSVSCSGRINHLLERKGRNRKYEFLVHHDRAMLAALDDQRARTHLEDAFRGL